MKLLIAPQKTIKELKTEFNTYFDLLKIEFFANPHKDSELSNHSDVIDDDLCVHDVNQKFTDEVTYEFTEKTTVSEFEQTWNNEFGLPVQVHKMFGGVWIETSRTDKWTLQEQYEMCKAAVDQSEIFKPEKHDYDLEDKR